MTRSTFPVLSFALIASLVLSAAATGYLRTGHAIANTGLTDIVICGSEGIRTVTLDREGKPVERQVGCAHCSDCILTNGIEASRLRMHVLMSNDVHIRWSLPDKISARGEGPLVRRARGPPTFVGPIT